MQMEIHYEIKRLELDFLEILESGRDLGGFTARYREIGARVKASLDTGSLPESILEDFNVVSQTLTILAETFKALRNLKSSPPKYPNHSSMQRFFLKNLHFPFPSANAIKLLSESSNMETTAVMDWFKLKRKQLGYGTLARTLCDNDKRLFKRYLRRVLLSSDADKSVPPHIKDAILKLRAHAYEMMTPRSSQKTHMKLPVASQSGSEFITRSSDPSITFARPRSLLDDCSVSASSSDASVCLDFIEPLTPESIHQLTIGNRKRKRDNSVQSEESADVRASKLQKYEEHRVWTSPTLDLEYKSACVQDEAVAKKGQDSIYTAFDFDSLFDPTNFQDCDASWLQSTIQDVNIPNTTIVAHNPDFPNCGMLFSGKTTDDEFSLLAGQDCSNTEQFFPWLAFNDLNPAKFSDINEPLISGSTLDVDPLPLLDIHSMSSLRSELDVFGVRGHHQRGTVALVEHAAVSNGLDTDALMVCQLQEQFFQKDFSIQSFQEQLIAV